MLLLLQLISQSIGEFSNIWSQGVYNYFNEIHTDFLKGKVLVKNFRSENIKYIKLTNMIENLKDLKKQEKELILSNKDYRENSKLLLEDINFKDIQVNQYQDLKKTYDDLNKETQKKIEEALSKILKKKNFIKDIKKDIRDLKVKNCVAEEKIEKLERENAYMKKCIKKGTR